MKEERRHKSENVGKKVISKEDAERIFRNKILNKQVKKEQKAGKPTPWKSGSTNPEIDKEQLVIKSKDLLSKIIDKLSFLSTKKASIADIENSLSLIKRRAKALKEILDSIGDMKNYGYAKSIQNKTDKLITELDINAYKKVSEVREQVEEILDRAKKIAIEEDELKFLDEGVEALGKLQSVKVSNLKDPAGAFSAPIIFTLNRRLKDTDYQVLENSLKLVRAMSGYYYIKNARLLAVDVARLKKDRSLEDHVTNLVVLINKRVHGSLVPIFDISTKVGNVYCILVVEDEAASAVENLLSAVESFKIMVEKA